MIKPADEKEVKRYLAKLQQISECDVVDYTETESQKNERKNRARKDYNFFVRKYFPHYAQSDCAEFHIKAANKVLKEKNIKAIMEWARGLAKSTHFDVFIPIWLHLFHDEMKCMILVGKSETAAKRLLGDLQAEFEANNQLKHDFGNLVQEGSWEDGNFRTTKGAAFFALGKKMSPRGARNGPHRPDYIVCDDLDDDEEIRNPKRVDDIVNWIKKALMPAMGRDRRRFVLVNNRIGEYTILSNMAENKKYYHMKVNALDKTGNPSWPEYYSKEFYDSIIEEIGLIAFNTEYQNEPHTEGKIFREEHIQWRPILKLNQYDRIVAYWDVAYSDSKSADCNAVNIVGLYGDEKHVLKAFCRHCTMEEAIRWMSNIHRRLPKTVTIEWYGESQFWNTSVNLAIQTVGKEFRFRMPLIFLDRPGRGSNKYSRIIQMLPAFHRREIYFNENEKYNLDMQENIRQLKGIEPGYKTHDDGPDSLEGAISKLEVTRATSDSEPVLGPRERPKRVY